MLTNSKRQQKIEQYGRGYEELVAALKRLPAEMWHFKPSATDWSVHQIIIHIADSETNSYIRCRRFIAEPGERLMAYDQETWAEALDYPQRSLDDALDLLRWVRLTTYKLIKSLPESVWSNTAYHPENGTMSLDDWLEIYSRHIPEHIDQMQRNYQTWQEHHG